MKFENQHAIVTGGSSGIGKATAQLLASLGAHISIIARSPLKLEAAKRKIEKARADRNQRVTAIAADVAKFREIQQAIEKASNSIGIPDILITSAGTAHPGYFQQLPIDIFEQTMAVNYFGSLYSIKAVLPLMESQQKGHIVLISSGAGLIGLYGYSAYSPSKFALRGLAESLRGELRLSGIRVSIVYPPDTDTPQLTEENQTKPLETKIITSTAKTWNAEDVAKEIVRGIAKKSFAIAPGLEMSLLTRLHSSISPALNWYFDRIVKRIHRQKE